MEASVVPQAAPAGVAALASPGLLRLLSDDRLVALIREGNTNAFEAAYDRHHRAILSFCRQMLGCAHEAEDAVQHTFLSAYSDLVSSRKPIRLRAWLFTIARNRCLSILRSRHERAALEVEERATDGLAAQVQRRQDLRDLVFDINQLPTDQRAALVLAEIGALSHDEIGAVIGVPKDKVKALIFQARESLLADRAAREADCEEIREQLATMRGAALRRTTLRRHLRACQACREYRHELERQRARRRAAAILPVLPTIALRELIVGAGGGGLVGAAGGGLVGASSLFKGMIAKGLIASVLAAAGTTGTIVAVHDLGSHRAVSVQRLGAAGGRPADHAASPPVAKAPSASAASAALAVAPASTPSVVPLGDLGRDSADVDERGGVKALNIHTPGPSARAGGAAPLSRSGGAAGLPSLVPRTHPGVLAPGRGHSDESAPGRAGSGRGKGSASSGGAGTRAGAHGSHGRGSGPPPGSGSGGPSGRSSNPTGGSTPGRGSRSGSGPGRGSNSGGRSHSASGSGGGSNSGGGSHSGSGPGAPAAGTGSDPGGPGSSGGGAGPSRGAGSSGAGGGPSRGAGSAGGGGPSAGAGPGTAPAPGSRAATSPGHGGSGPAGAPGPGSDPSPPSGPGGPGR